MLGITVSEELLNHWRDWLAPERQPFFLTTPEAKTCGLTTTARSDVRFTPEERDTNELWNVSRDADQVAWLSQYELDELTAGQRRELIGCQVRHGRGNLPRRRDYHDLLTKLPSSRFLWRPGLLTPAVLTRLISAGHHACQRDHLPARTWAQAAQVLPRVRELAGTFPKGSAGNCFGAVMGAAGVGGVEHEWVQRETFDDFLRTLTRPGGRDDQPGTLLVWRSHDGQPQHAAVTLGGGWAFEKPSQSWMTPRVVLSVSTLKRANRAVGQRLERHRLC